MSPTDWTEWASFLDEMEGQCNGGATATICSRFGSGMTTDNHEARRAGDPAAALAGLVEKVRRASCAGIVLPLAEVWHGSEAELAGLLACLGPDSRDVEILREGGHCYLYCGSQMSAGYARTAALAAAGNLARAIAETVRRDSSTYPRPTPADSFTRNPFNLTNGQIAETMRQIGADSGFGDVQPVRASDGTLFLFSTKYLDRARAESMAERIAVTRFENP